MEKYEVNKSIQVFEQQISGLKNVLGPVFLQERLDELSNQMISPIFWDQPNQAQIVTKEADSISNKLKSYYEIKEMFDEIVEWNELSMEETEEWEVLVSEIFKLKDMIEDFELQVILNGEYDANSAILEIHPGAGGTESQDWAGMLFRMYERYAQKKNYQVELLDYQNGEEAGVKSATLLIKGEYAYGYLKSEKGVHRLVRISPFDSNAKRHTSFVSINVMPEINDDINIIVKDEELKIDVYRSSGAGGQSVNTTDSAVRITHLPTGIVVTCQNERSQIKNRETAMRILKSRLLEEELKKKEMELANIKGEKKEIGWGSQIRSYVFHPYQMVKDHRTNYEVGNVEIVMDGELDGFTNAYLRGMKK